MIDLKTLMKSALVGAVMAVTPVVAGATTVVPTIDNTIAPDVEYDFGTLGNDTYDTAAINLQDALATLLEMVVTGTGSLTLTTYVDPFIPSGVGAANVLVSIFATTPLPVNSVTVQWGAGDVVDLSGGTQSLISTTFSGIGVANGEDLVFSWTGMTGNNQISAQVASVPLPAAGWMLLTALGGLGIARRRRKAA